jgi:heat shock protein HslJ
MKKIIVWVVIIGVILIAGFYVLNAYIYNEKQADSNPYAPEKLQAKTWTWINVVYADGTVITPRQTNAFTLSIKNDGSFDATTDCNQLGGRVTINNGAISFSDIFSTKKFCEGSQEEDFKKVLDRAAGYLFTERGELVLDIERDTGAAIFR